jgi:hypothetical protein
MAGTAAQPGGTLTGRILESLSFVSYPDGDIAANVIYMPDITETLFGVSEVPVVEDVKGTFFRDGTWKFTKPGGWVSAAGQKVHWVPTGQGAGAFALTGGIVVGHEVIDTRYPSTLNVSISPNGEADLVALRTAANVADSTAVDVAACVVDINLILAALKAALLMTPDA